MGNGVRVVLVWCLACAAAAALPVHAQRALVGASGAIDDITALLIAEPGDAIALTAAADAALAQTRTGDEATLRAYATLAQTRALVLRSRFAEADTALRKVHAQLGTPAALEQRALLAAATYQRAALEEARSPPLPSCGDLGLARVAQAEAVRTRERLDALIAGYRAVVHVGDRFWARRAAFRIASLSEDFFRAVLLRGNGYRGVKLPHPLAVSSVETSELIEPMFEGAWPSEIARLYAELERSFDTDGPDPVLRTLVRARAVAFAERDQPQRDHAHNPWFSDEKPGLTRFTRRHERKAVNGAWVMVTPAQGASSLDTQAKAPVESVEYAYALAGLALEGRAPPDAAAVRAALEHASARVRLSGLLAVEMSPHPTMLEPVLRVFREAEQEADSGGTGELFHTLQEALYGLRERAVLALRAIAEQDRAVAEQLALDSSLPARERAFIVADLAEPRLIPALQGLARDRDPRVAATATYGLLLIGRRHGRPASMAYPHEPGPVGCVVRALERAAER